MRLPVLISACLWLATTSLFAKEPEFSRSRDLPPLKLVAADLDTILQKVHSLIAAANGPVFSVSFATDRRINQRVFCSGFTMKLIT